MRHSTIHLGCHQTIPILGKCDDLLVQGSLANCVAAWELARRARRVALVTCDNSIPFEFVVCRRPWLVPDDLERLPGAVAEAFSDSVEEKRDDGELILNLTRLSIRIEDLLLDEGVRLLYSLHPCGVLSSEDVPVAGVIFGGKVGLVAIEADVVIDGTQTADVAALAGHAAQARVRARREVEVSFTARAAVDTPDSPPVEGIRASNHCSTVRLEQEAIPAPGVEFLVGQRIVLHGPYAEFRFRLPLNLADLLWRSRLSTSLRRAVSEVGAVVTQTRRDAGEPRVMFSRYPDGLITEPLVRIHGSPRDPARARGLTNVWVSGATADVDDTIARELASPFQAAKEAAKVVGTIAALPTHQPEQRELRPGLEAGKPDDGDAELLFRDAPFLHGPMAEVPLASLSLPVLACHGVLVVGAGTSGVPASISAARQGADTALVERHSDVGGTRTVGGVGHYWYGRETDFLRALDAELDRRIDESSMTEEIGMLETLLKAGVEVLTACPIVACIREGDDVIGAVVALPSGPAALMGNAVIDATGDADLAAWAGAPYQYGNGRDAVTIWTSFGNWTPARRTASRQYDSAIECRDPVDLARTVITGRRRQGMWSREPHEMPQHYIASRESRRILGRARITYGGILAGQTFSDLMLICESNFDIKGLAVDDMLCSGLVSSWDVRETFCAAVPYAAILPQGVDGLIVVGRSLSASHEAQSLARMQRDMAAMGGCAGIAAAWASESFTLPHSLDVGALQGEWIRRGLLTREEFSRYGVKPETYGDELTERDARALAAGGQPYQPHLAALMRCSTAVDGLYRAFGCAASRRAKINIARALCFHGDTRTVDVLLEIIAEQVSGELPGPHQKNLWIPPEHGWAPDPVYSTYAVGLTDRGRELALVLETLASKVDDSAERFASKHESQFEYVHVVCQVAERNPGAAMVPALEILLAKACLRDLMIPYDSDPRRATDSGLEKRSYLELCVGRALARCGDRRGYDILLAYLDDVRGVLARSARDELAELLGEPAERDRWSRVLRRQEDPLPAKPFTRKLG